MKILNIRLIVLFVILINTVLIAQEEKGKIKIEVNGFTSDEGTARILIFSTKEKDFFPSNSIKCFIKKIVNIKNKKVIYEFIDIPYGDYAIAIHHDINGDGKVNTNWVGIPNEGLGCSKDAKGFFGPPSFDKAKVNLNSKEIELKINMVN